MQTRELSGAGCRSVLREQAPSSCPSCVLVGVLTGYFRERVSGASFLVCIVGDKARFCFERTSGKSQLEPVSRKSRNFKGFSLVSRCSLYLKNGGDLSPQTSWSVSFLVSLQHILRTSGL